MKLCASRAFWLVAYPSQGYEMLFDALTLHDIVKREAAFPKLRPKLRRGWGAVKNVHVTGM